MRGWRRIGLAAALGSILFAGGCEESRELPNLEARVFEAVNRERLARGRPPLSLRADLTEVARRHNRDMIRRGELSHIASDGRRLEERLSRRGWVAAGENLARNRGFDDPVNEAVRGWINSPTHAANLFNSEFRETGIAVQANPKDGYLYFTQIFVNPGR